MTGQQILNRFHLYTGDQSDLSASDELNLLNSVYDNVLNSRPWEILKKPATGTITVTGGVATIALPSDFRHFIENNQQTDNSSTVYNNASPKVIFVGSNYTPYQLINFSDRRQYRNTSGYAYPDLINNQVVFTAAPTDTAYEFDYIKQWDALTLATSPIFPSDCHDMLASLMAVDSVIINLFDRAHSYAPENQKAADNAMKKLGYWNSMLTFN